MYQLFYKSGQIGCSDVFYRCRLYLDLESLKKSLFNDYSNPDEVKIFKMSEENMVKVEVVVKDV